MNPRTHLLSLTVLRVGDDYTARCRCGLDVYGRTLPELWENHSEQLAVVLAKGRAS